MPGYPASFITRYSFKAVKEFQISLCRKNNSERKGTPLPAEKRRPPSKNFVLVRSLRKKRNNTRQWHNTPSGAELCRSLHALMHTGLGFVKRRDSCLTGHSPGEKYAPVSLCNGCKHASAIVAYLIRKETAQARVQFPGMFLSVHLFCHQNLPSCCSSG